MEAEPSAQVRLGAQEAARSLLPASHLQGEKTWETEDAGSATTESVFKMGSRFPGGIMMLCAVNLLGLLKGV